MYFVSLFKDLYSNHDCGKGLRNVACMALIILYCCIGCCPRRSIRVAWAAAAIRAKETEEEGRRKLTRGGADEKAAYPEMGRHKLTNLVPFPCRDNQVNFEGHTKVCCSCRFCGDA